MKTERIEVHIELVADGRLRATSPDELILAGSDHSADLRRDLEQAVKARFRDSRPLALMVGRRLQRLRSS
jgi:hypothetical protein